MILENALVERLLDAALKGSGAAALPLVDAVRAEFAKQVESEKKQDAEKATNISEAA